MPTERTIRYREYNARYSKEYYRKNKERLLENARQKRLANPELAKARSRKYNAKRKEKNVRRVKQWRKENPDKEAEQRRKYKQTHRIETNARNLIAKMVARGELPPAKDCTCACGQSAAHYHHPDYSQPRTVIPVCVSCHNKIHNEIMDLPVMLQLVEEMVNESR